MVQNRYPSIRTMTDWQDLLNDPDIDAVAIATPVSSHFELAMAALGAKNMCWSKNPWPQPAEQALQLIDEAARRQRVLMVDHTFVYTGAVSKIRELIADNALGEIYYYDAVRVNLGLFQHDVNVIWDLAIHDLSIMDYVLPSRALRFPQPGSATFPANRKMSPTSRSFLPIRRLPTCMSIGSLR